MFFFLKLLQKTASIDNITRATDIAIISSSDDALAIIGLLYILKEKTSGEKYGLNIVYYKEENIHILILQKITIII